MKKGKTIFVPDPMIKPMTDQERFLPTLIENKHEFNGWSNRLTWVVHLWLDNDRSLNNEMKSFCKKATCVSEIAASCRQMVEEDDEFIDDGRYSRFFHDFIGYALAEVNWGEIAEFWACEYNPSILANA